MDELEILRKLSARAREEQPPKLDVANSVAAMIRTADAPDDRVCWIAAAVSSLAALLVGAAAWQMLAAHMNPLNDLFTPLVM